MLKLCLLILAVALYYSDGANMHFLDHDFERSPLGDAIDKASVKLLKEAYTAAEDKNVVTSPFGVLMLLSMYSAGAGESEGIKEEIVKILGSSNYDELYKSFTSLSDRFASMDPDYLTIANKIYVDDKYELVDQFSNEAVRSYHSEIEKIKFSDPPLAAAAINHWSDEKTKGHIKNPVSETDLDPSVVAALFNVIFFQGHWNVPFKANETEETDFYVDKIKTVKKPMMHLEQSLFFHESPEIDATLVELPYKEKGFRMVVVLPHETDGLSSVLEKVEQRGLLTDVFSLTPHNCEVILDMPKFEIQSGLDLNKLLPKMGVSKIFSEPATGIVKEDFVRVDKAFQKAFVKVDEEGATAGAFTGAVMVTMSSNSRAPPPKVIKVDHPFMFAILHDEVMLFAGIYSH